MDFSKIKPEYDAIDSIVSIMVSNSSSMVYPYALDTFLISMIDIKKYLRSIQDVFIKEENLECSESKKEQDATR